jgi:hypothetical protein
MHSHEAGCAGVEEGPTIIDPTFFDVQADAGGRILVDVRSGLGAPSTSSTPRVKGYTTRV